ncbi:hypothetical protein ACIQV3_40490 [Streptomyces sp. NPDC099050]|uniref:hypothetical protein n=1 Tax=Streptomyces sp. NPDC099050 TaxID=3366100 RepID=UPI0038024335
MKGFRTAMTVIGAAVVLGIVGTAVVPVAAIAAPAARAAVVADAVPDAWVEVFNGTHFRVMVDDHKVAPTRVDVRPVGSDVVVATLDEFQYESDTVGSGEPDIGWYEANDELRLDGMGDYELDVYVPANGGGVVGRKAAGRFTYALDPKLEVASDQKEFSLDDLGTNATGSVTAVHPLTGVRGPLAGARVTVQLGWGRSNVVSDSAGKFTTRVAAQGQEYSLALSARLEKGVGTPSAAQPVRIRPQQAALTLSGPSNGLTVRYGAEPTFRGAITRVTDDGKTVAAAGRIVMAEPAQTGGSTASSRSEADGTFAVSPRVTAAGSWKVSSQDPWLGKAPAQTATVAKVTHTTDVVEEKVVSTDRYRKMTISGKIVVDGVTTQKAPVEIQAQVGGGRWVTQKTLTVDYNKTFTTTVEVFAEFPASPWRIYSPGTQNIGPSTGADLRPGRLQTRFELVRVGPKPVRKGETMFVAGTLKTYGPSGHSHNYPGRKVRYYFKPTGGTAWKEMGSSITRADGTFGAKFKAVSDGTWRVRHVDTDAQHFASTSHAVYLDVS